MEVRVLEESFNRCFGEIRQQQSMSSELQRRFNFASVTED